MKCDRDHKGEDKPDALVVLHCAACGKVIARCAKCESGSCKAKHSMISHIRSSFCVARATRHKLPNKEFR